MGKAATKNIPLIFPNPAQGETWMSLQSSEKTIVSIYLSDMSGRIIKILKIPLKKGNNLIPINELTKQAGGMYIVKVKSIDGETTQKLLLKK